MAIDENVDAIRSFMDGITYPVLLDTEHVLTELYAISNVPTVVMIDEEGRIAHPNWHAFGSDKYREYTGIDSAAQIDVVRKWVLTGNLPLTPDEAKSAVGDLTPDEESARLYFRIANHLHHQGDEDGASRNFDKAAELAPTDWTIRRAMMPLRGGDPFGDEFFALAAEFEAAGRPFHGVAANRE